MLAPDGTVEGVNGGHAHPFIWRAGEGQVTHIGSGGPALGMIEGEDYTAHEPVAMGSGDVLVIYTDGLTEARDPNEHDRMFGEEGVRKALAERGAAGASAREICLGIVEEAMALTGNLREDDITVVVARRA